MSFAKALTLEIFGHDVNASHTLHKIGAEAEKSGGKFRKFGHAAGLALGAVAIGLTAFAVESVKTYADAEKSQVKLEFAFGKFKALHDINIGSLRKYNLALQDRTTFSKNDTAVAEGTLAQYKLTGKQIRALIPLVQDFAVKTGKDLPDAAQAVGKAMVGQGRALKAVGIRFVDTKTVAGNFREVLSGLTEKVGGLARAAGGTASGKLAILRNKLADVKEEVGKALMPFLTKLLDWLTGPGLAAFKAFAAFLTGPGIAAIKNVTNFAVDYHIGLKDIAIALGVAKVAQFGLNAAMSANPVGAVISALVILISTVMEIVNHLDDVTKWATKNPLLATFVSLMVPITGITTAISIFAQKPGLVQKAYGALPGFFKSKVVDPVLGYFGKLPGRMQTFARQSVDHIFRLFLKLPPWLGTVARTAILNMVAWFQKLPGRAQAALSTMPAKIAFVAKVAMGRAVAWFEKLPDRLLTIGRNMVAGMAQGFKLSSAGALKIIRQVAGSIVQGVKNFFGIKSPSTVFTGIGANLMRSLGLGVLRSATGLQGVFGRVFRGVKRNVTGAMSALGGAGNGLFGKIFGNLGGGGDFTGGASRRGGAGGAARWADPVLAVLRMLGQPAGLLPAVLRRINLESGGNPRAINLWDSNAKAGHPSMGLMQTIQGTFNANAGPFRGRGVWDPMANIYAGLNYALHRYGSIGAIDPLVRPYGYDRGGILPPGLHLVYNGTGKPETIVPPGAGQTGGGGVQIQIIQKVGGINLSDLIDMRIKTASGWQAMEFGSGVGR